MFGHAAAVWLQGKTPNPSRAVSDSVPANLCCQQRHTQYRCAGARGQEPGHRRCARHIEQEPAQEPRNQAGGQEPARQRGGLARGQEPARQHLVSGAAVLGGGRRRARRPRRPQRGAHLGAGRHGKVLCPALRGRCRGVGVRGGGGARSHRRHRRHAHRRLHDPLHHWAGARHRVRHRRAHGWRRKGPPLPVRAQARAAVRPRGDHRRGLRGLRAAAGRRRPDPSARHARRRGGPGRAGRHHGARPGGARALPPVLPPRDRRGPAPPSGGASCWSSAT